MTKVRAEVLVTGRVQGVWFRQSTKNTADQYGVYGWCCNNLDGSVEAVFEGKEAAVQAAVNWCKSGPKFASVNNTQVEWKTATGEFDRFEIR